MSHLGHRSTADSPFRIYFKYLASLNPKVWSKKVMGRSRQATFTDKKLYVCFSLSLL